VQESDQRRAEREMRGKSAQPESSMQIVTSLRIQETPRRLNYSCSYYNTEPGNNINLASCNVVDKRRWGNGTHCGLFIQYIPVPSYSYPRFSEISIHILLTPKILLHSRFYNSSSSVTSPWSSFLSPKLLSTCLSLSSSP